MKRQMVVLILCGLMMVSISLNTASALCNFSSWYITYTDRQSCNYGCGFLGFGRQDSWTETTTYRCVNGDPEKVTRYNVHNGKCC